MSAPVQVPTRWPASPVPRYFDPVEHGLGLLVPVVGGHPGAGASGVALAVADAAAAAGLRTLLIDGADPARSGLANVWTSQLRSDAPCQNGATVGTVARAGLMGRQLRGIGHPLPSRLYPALTEWASVDFRRHHAPFEVTVVDVGWNAWTGFNEVRFGPLAWVGAASASACPVLVTTATLPSLRLTAGVHARWSAALAAREIDAAPRLVVSASTAMSPALRFGGPPSVVSLLDDDLCFPFVPSAATGGWSEQPLPRSALAAGTRLLGASAPELGARLPSTGPTPARFRRTPKET